MALRIEDDKSGDLYLCFNRVLSSNYLTYAGTIRQERDSSIKEINFFSPFVGGVSWRRRIKIYYEQKRFYFS